MLDKVTFGNYQEIRYKLDCGLNIRYYPYLSYHSAYMGFVIPYGSNMSEYRIDNERVKTGIAHFLEHRMFDAGDHDMTNDFAKVGASCNAYTFFDRTCYYCSTSSKPLDAFKILFDLVTNFYSTDERIENEKKIIIQESIMGQANPGRVLIDNVGANLFNNAIIKDPIIGYKKDILETSKKDLVNAYEAFYSLSNMTLVLVGNVDVNEIIDYINKNKKENIGNKHIIEKLNLVEDYNKVNKKSFENQMEMSDTIHNISFKFDVSKFKEKYPKYKFDQLISSTFELMYGESSLFYNEFNKLDVSNNSLYYEYLDIGNVGMLSFSFISKKSRQMIKMIKESLLYPTKYLTEKSKETFLRKDFGSKIKMLQNIGNLFDTLTDELETEYTFMEECSSRNEISLEDIEGFLNYIGKSKSVHGVMSPKRSKRC